MEDKKDIEMSTLIKEIKETEEMKEIKEIKETNPKDKETESASMKEANVKDGRDEKSAEEGEGRKFSVKALATILAVIVLAAALVVVGILILKKNFGSSKKTDNNEAAATEKEEIPATGSPKTKGNKGETITELTTNGINDTGDYTLYATEYEGREGTGNFNYGEALQKAILFYELQRSGDLPEKTRCNWRGDSALSDGADNGVDLTGGLYDAGDHVKFNLPMAYTASVLTWSYYENPEAYTESGQKDYALNNIRWIDDYLMKCHTEKEVFYYQVGNGGLDHGWWGPCEVMTMDRPSYKVDAKNPGSTVSAEAAAALASGAVIFEKEDKAYADKCLEHAVELYDFAAKYLSDAGYTEANGYYNSYSGFYDELSFAATWLYLATGKESYKQDAKKWFDSFDGNYKWTLSWDDVSLGTALLMGRETKDRNYLDYLENNLDYWTTGVGGERITYTPKGLAWLDSWGSLRYASNAAFLALTYADSDVCPKEKKQTYHDFAVSQIDYCLGSTGFSYEIGFGEDYPVHPHHRTAQGSPSNNMNDPSESRHILCGALVGGPDANDSYTDEVSNYVNNEVADDYNAGFVGALAALYEEFGGKTLVNYGAVENVDGEEIHVEGNVNVNGDGFIEVRAYIYNASAWPARALTDATLCYFVDLSEVYEAGGSVADISVNMNYSQGGSAAELKAYDEDRHIYYLPVSFAGTTIAPGTQDTSKKEVQFRMTSSSVWDNRNDYSYQDIEGAGGGTLNPCEHMALYEGDTLVYGSLPDEKGKITGNKTTKKQKGSDKEDKEKDKKEEDAKDDKEASITEDGLKLEMANSSDHGKGSSMAFTVNLTNEGTKDLNLSDLAIHYYFTEPDPANLNFYCDYACIQGNQYKAVTDSVRGSFETVKSSDKNISCKLLICLDKKEVLPAGHTLNIQVRVARSDWTEMNFDDDYSAKGAGKILVTDGGKTVLGKEPE